LEEYRKSIAVLKDKYERFTSTPGAIYQVGGTQVVGSAQSLLAVAVDVDTQTWQRNIEKNKLYWVQAYGFYKWRYNCVNYGARISMRETPLMKYQCLSLNETRMRMESGNASGLNPESNPAAIAMWFVRLDDYFVPVVLGKRPL
jgi:hypothetical protein